MCSTPMLAFTKPLKQGAFCKSFPSDCGRLWCKMSMKRWWKVHQQKYTLARIKSINQSHILDGFEFWLNLMLQNRSSWRFHRIFCGTSPSGGLLELITMVLQMDAMPVLGGAHRNRQSSFVVVVVVVVVLPCGKTQRKAGWNMGPPMFNRGKLKSSNFKRVHFQASYVSFWGIFVSFHRWCVFPSPTGSGFSQKNPEPTYFVVFDKHV